jgi:PleD family two-component response regulator
MDDKIVVVDDDPGTIYLVGRILHGVSQLSFATSGEKALQLVQDCAPDLVLLDAELPGMSGFKVFDALQAAPELLGVPIIFITSHTDAGFEVSALNMGAADFIAKPFTPAQLLARVKTHLRTKHIIDELRRTVSTDALTGMGSRHCFEESLRREWLRGLRGGSTLTTSTYIANATVTPRVTTAYGVSPLQSRRSSDGRPTSWLGAAANNSECSCHKRLGVARNILPDAYSMP